MKKSLKQVLLAATMVVVATTTAQATVIGYWRMEVDDDPSADAISVANEVAGNPLIAAGTGFGLNATVPAATVLQTGAANTMSMPGKSGAGNGAVATYAALNMTGSITVEFWARTSEGVATFVRHSTTAGATDKGFVIDSPNDVRVSFRTGPTAGSAGTTTTVLQGGIDLGTTFTHIAWTYDQATGVGNLYQDGVLKATNTGTAGDGLTWFGVNTSLLISNGIDASAANGGMDEVRISDVALDPTLFLNAPPVPEPSSFALLALSMTGLTTLRRRRR